MAWFSSSLLKPPFCEPPNLDDASFKYPPLAAAEEASLTSASIAALIEEESSEEPESLVHRDQT